VTALEPIAAPQTLASHAREAVLKAIGDGRLEPGSLHSVAQLATQLGVSRTPVREALLMLEREGRVRFERNRGVRVLVPTAHDIAEVFELRVLLEVPTTAGAAGRVDLDALQTELDGMAAAADAADEGAFMDHDERFHALILAGSGNRRLVAAVAALRDSIRGRGASTVGRSRSLQEIQAEHAAILDALRADDGDRAAAAMRYHLRRTGDLLAAQSGGGDAATPA
jgi:DNA-binding GntR family transcriptional regulator